MGEECNMTVTSLIGVDQREVAFEQLEQKPEAMEDPRRGSHRNPACERQDVDKRSAHSGCAGSG
jgi:hypothetical protein